MKKGKWLRSLFGVGAGVVICTASATVAAPNAGAEAVTCWGDWCSGQDPMTTGCAADAVTVAALQLDDGRLEVRWSPTCKTNWARYQQYPYGSFASETPLALAAVQDTGYQQSINWDEADGGSPIQVGTYWTPMIYSPDHLVYAGLAMQCGDATLFSAAMDCLINGQEKTAAV